jgi:hypothetical protein
MPNSRLKAAYHRAMRCSDRKVVDLLAAARRGGVKCSFSQTFLGQKFLARHQAQGSNVNTRLAATPFCPPELLGAIEERNGGPDQIPLYPCR